ncbi:MAG: hypothetical protein QOI82_1462 [Actinomycetota bacterium]|nr:hypothetical protein [Actinomycetota bacterium]
MEYGKQYALLRGLLDPAYPQLAFIVELPFRLEQLAEGVLGIVVPMTGMRCGESEDTYVRVRVGHVSQEQRGSTAPFGYLRSLPGRTAPDQRPMPPPSARKMTVRRRVTVVELVTPNVLPDAAPGTRDTEVAVRLFNRCMQGLNRFLGAYMVATEDPSVRQLSPEALGDFVLVELRDLDDEPLGSSGLLTLPRATRPEHFNALDDASLLERLGASMRHEGVSHPMDTVVRWQVRARHYSEVAGDYEMALISLNTSAEVLIDAIWSAHRVDESRDSSLYEEVPQFSKTLKIVAKELGRPWTSEPENVWARYYQDCYQLRNDIAHEGRQVNADELDAALDAYEALRAACVELTIATAETYPRTALLVNGSVGLQKAGALHGAVAAELAAIRQAKALAFWLPADLRVPDEYGDAEVQPGEVHPRDARDPE